MNAIFSKPIKDKWTYFQDLWSFGVRKNGISQGLWFPNDLAAKAYCDRMNNQ